MTANITLVAILTPLFLGLALGYCLARIIHSDQIDGEDKDGV